MNVHLTPKQIEMHDYHAHDPADDVETDVPVALPAVVEPISDDDTANDDGIIPHGEVGASAAELARNLPELVENLRRLRLEMEKCNKIYEAINLSQRASGKIAASDDDERESTYSGKASVEEFDPSAYGPPMIARASSAASVANRRSMQQMQPPALRSSLRVSTLMQQSVSYSVMWVSGECGISLRNFSSNKIGAQIAVLQQADGVTTGISNCRLGDQLIFVNDEAVEDMRFKDIVQKLKTTRRPITLGFRNNPNVQTSPTAVSSMNRSTMNRPNSSKGFFGGSSSNLHNGDFDDYSRASTTQMTNADLSVDRQTYSSMRSSTSTLSDDIELFCKEQEEMHSDVIVLLTETVLRCEKLQQQNLDQLQSLMQLAPNVHATETHDSDSARTMSSLAPVKSPAVAVLRESMLEAARSSNGSVHSSGKWTPSTATSA